MSGRPEFTVLDGGLDKATFVCTYCASKFPTRRQLFAHWVVDVRCKSNRYVSNPTQSKYNDAPVEELVGMEGEPE